MNIKSKVLSFVLIFSFLCSPSFSQQENSSQEENTSSGPSQTESLFGIGGSFDLIDDVVSKVYFDIDILVPDLSNEDWHKEQYSTWSFFGFPKGIRAGFFRGTTPTEIDTNMIDPRFFIDGPSQDSALQVSRRILRERKSRRDVLGLHFSLSRPISKNVHWVVHSELWKRSYTFNFRDSIISADTSVVERTRLPISALAPPTESLSQATIYQAYFGVGALFYYWTDAIDLRVQPVVARGSALDRRFSDGSLWYYMVHFQAMEKELGISFGGKVRGSFSGENPDLILYVSKNFDFQKLASKISFNNGD